MRKLLLSSLIVALLMTSFVFAFDSSCSDYFDTDTSANYIGQNTTYTVGNLTFTGLAPWRIFYANNCELDYGNTVVFETRLKHVQSTGGITAAFFGNTSISYNEHSIQFLGGSNATLGIGYSLRQNGTIMQGNNSNMPVDTWTTIKMIWNASSNMCGLKVWETGAEPTNWQFNDTCYLNNFNNKLVSFGTYADTIIIDYWNATVIDFGSFSSYYKLIDLNSTSYAGSAQRSLINLTINPTYTYVNFSAYFQYNWTNKTVYTHNHSNYREYEAVFNTPNLVWTYNYSWFVTAIKPDTSTQVYEIKGSQAITNRILNISVYSEILRNYLEIVTIYAFDPEQPGVNYSAITAGGVNWKEFTNVPFGNYTIKVEKAGYYPREYYTQVTPSSGVVAVQAFLLETTNSTLITFHVVDQNDDFFVNSTIKVLRFYPENNTYSTVAMQKTDYSGLSLFYLVPYSVDYVFIIEKDGRVWLQTQNAKITSADVYLRVTTSTPMLQTYNKIKGVSYSLTYTNATKQFSLSISDANGIVRDTCLEVKRIDANNDVKTVCSDSTASILLVNTTEWQGDYIATATVFDNLNNKTHLIAQKEVKNIEDWLNFGKMGVLMTVLVIGVLVAFGSFMPEVSIVLGILGLGAGMLLHLIPLTAFALIMIIAMGVVIIYKMRS